jgi:mannitol/fructose-specific phosphotransferase system IIA component (Ntr-type)
MGAMLIVIKPDISETQIKIAAICVCSFFGITNLFSVKESSRFQNILVGILILILIGYSVFGVNSVNINNFQPFIPYGFDSVFAVTGMVFVSFGGINTVAAIAGEVHNSKKNLVWGLISAFTVVLILYVWVIFVTVGVLEADRLEGSLIPVQLCSGKLFGNIGFIIIGLAAFLAFATTANGGIMTASRTPFAMSRDGLLPEIFSRTNSKFHTPDFAILLTTTFMILIIIFLNIEDLVKTASAMMILTYVFSNIAVVVMKYSGIQTYRPTFIAPLNPYLQIVSSVIYIFLIFEMGYFPLMLALGFSVIAGVWYLVYVQRKIDRESAIVYLVKSIVSRHITRSGIEDELKQISIERDEITPDRFDKLVHNCPILDIEQKIDAKDFLKKAADMLSEKIGYTPEKLYQLFLDREKESSTIIKPGLAIPHIVVEGNGIFQILLARCKGGVVFSELSEPVHTFFVLLGSQDERNYHLRALMNIAHIVSEPDFDKRWSDAKNIEQLRDIVLLSKRKREK